MRMQRMLKILSKIFVKKRRKIGDLTYDHGLTNLRLGANLFFIEIYYDHCLHDLHLIFGKC